MSPGAWRSGTSNGARAVFVMLSMAAVACGNGSKNGASDDDAAGGGADAAPAVHGVAGRWRGAVGNNMVNVTLDVLIGADGTIRSCDMPGQLQVDGDSVTGAVNLHTLVPGQLVLDEVLVVPATISAQFDADKGSISGTVTAGLPQLQGSLISLTRVGDAAPKAVAVLAAEWDTCALIDDGTVKCWGENVGGQLGTGRTYAEENFRACPADVSTLANAAKISGDFNMNCALDSEGIVRCWGRHSDDQSGGSLTPTQAATDAIDIDARSVVTRAGTVEQLDAAGGAYVPGATQAVPVGIQQLAEGLGFWCGVKGDGTVQCWKQLSTSNILDSLGTIGTVSADGIVTVAVDQAVYVDVGGTRACALKQDSSVVCWGTGPVGDGTDTLTSPPSAVVSLSDAIDVSVGQDFACAVRRGGTVSCWGSPFESGSTGSYQRRDVLTPTDVPGVAGAVKVSVGAQQACALTQNGGVACWGANGHGELGIGATSEREDTAQPVATLGE